MNKDFLKASALAIALIAGVTLIKAVIGITADAPLVLYYSAIILAAWWGGLRPGLVATVAASSVVLYYAPHIKDLDSRVTYARPLFFVLEGTLISIVCDRLKKSMRAAARRQEILAKHYDEAVIRQAERNHIFSAVKDYAIFTLDREGKIASWSEASARIKGWTAEEVMGHHFSIFHPPEAVAEGLPEKELTHAATAGHFNQEAWRLKSDGSRYWARVSLSPLKDDHGGIWGFVKILRDLTEERAVQSELKAREAELADFVENAAIGLHWVDADGIIIWANRHEMNMLGYSRDEYIGHPISEFHVDGNDTEDILTRLISNEALDTREARLRCKDGSIRHVLTNSNVFWENGAFGHTRCFTRDITERKRAEQALLESEERYRTVAETASDAIITIDAKSNILFINDAASAIFGHTVGEMVGQSLTMLMPEGLRRLHGEGLARYVETSSKHISWNGIELPGLHKKGHEIPLEVSFSESVKDGKHYFTGIARDITERRRTDEALRESERQLRTLADAVPQLVWMAEPDGHIFWYNQQWYDYTGTTPEGMEGWGWQSVHDPKELPGVMEKWRHSIRTGAPCELEFPLRGADGVFRWFLTRVNPLLDSEGRVVRWFGTNTDIDGQRRTAEELRQAGRLKDEFLATLSHELRTPMTAILGWARMLQQNAVSPGQIPDALATIVRSANSMTKVVDDLLDISRIVRGQLKLETRPCEVTAIINAAMSLMQPAANAKGIRLECYCDEHGETFVSADADRLQQILWNLLSNAVKFTPADGKVSVSCQMTADQRSVEITIADTGQGINPEFLPHMFERFSQAETGYSRPHGGLGIGLAIVKHLTELHGGEVEAKSAGQDQGASFKLRLPALSQGRRGPSGPLTPVISRLVADLHGRRIIAVDDEPDTVNFIRAALERAGAIVTVCYSAGQAEREIISSTTPYDLLISDIGMPGGDGFSLITRLRQSKYRLPAIALTAYSRSDDRRAALSAGFQDHLPKPVEPDEICLRAAALLPPSYVE